MMHPTIAFMRALDERATTHAAMMGIGSNPSLIETDQLMAPDPPELTLTFAALWIQIIHIRIIYGEALVHNNINDFALHSFLSQMKDREEAPE